MDFAEHNAQTRALWDAYNVGNPPRVPVTVGISSRFGVYTPWLNPKGYTMKDYCTNPDAMLDIQLSVAEFIRFKVDADHEMGVPEDGWWVSVDFQNYYEAAWLGCPFEFPAVGMPMAHPFLGDDNKEEVFHRGLPDPFSGLMKDAMRFLERFHERAPKIDLHGQSVKHISNGAGLWTDGPFTIACELRGLENFCVDIYEDPEYALRLLDYTTEAIITKTKAWRKFHGMPEKSDVYGFADDSITMLSPLMVEELMIPFYKRIISQLCTENAEVSMHLCGDAGAIFPVIHRALGISEFDTGFPLDHADLARKLVGRASFGGGPHIGLLHSGSAEQVRAETIRILQAVMPITKRFHLRDGNDIAPGTPLENIDAMVKAVREHGVYA